MKRFCGISDDERQTLLDWSRCLRRPHLAMRAKIVLLTLSEPFTCSQVARTLGTSRRSVAKWTKKFRAGGLAALMMEGMRPGRPSQHRSRRRAVLEQNERIQEPAKPADDQYEPENHRLSQRELSRRLAVPLATLNRSLQREAWRLSRGFIKRQQFVEEGSPVVGLYLDPPMRVIAIRMNAAGSPRRVQPVEAIGIQVRGFSDFVGDLERRLVMSGKAAGQEESLGRFLRMLSNVELNRRHGSEIHLFCWRSSNAARHVIANYWQFNSHCHSISRFEEWFTGELVAKGLAGFTAGGDGRAINYFTRSVMRHIDRIEKAGKALGRPFRFVAKREPAGFDRYFGDAVTVLESNMDKAARQQSQFPQGRMGAGCSGRPENADVSGF